jgi:hypothetical protein
MSADSALVKAERLTRVQRAWRLGHRDRVLRHLPLLLIVGVAFGITAIWVRSIHTFSIMPDELGYVKQSLEIARTGLPLGPHDFYFNSWGQLLPAISAPVFGALSMVDAFYAAHTLYALLLASTAVPAYLLACELDLGRLAAHLVAALSVAVPWMALSGVVMTEDVAYPVFAWAMLAIVRALHTPSARRDVVAIAAIALAFFARTQFVVLGPILVVSVIGHDLGIGFAARGQASSGGALVAGLRQMRDRHRVLWVLSGVAAIAVIAIAITGSAQSVLGNYVTPTHGALLPTGTLTAGLEQLDGVVLGTGVVPLTLTIAWVLATVIGPREPKRHAFAVLLVVTVPVLVVMLGSFQQNVLGGNTTDRYFFYIVPLLFVGTAAWVVDRRGSLTGLVLVGAGVAWMLMVTTLHYSTGFSITNPSYNFHRVLIGKGAALGNALGISNLDPRIPITVATSAFVLLAVALRRWLSTRLALLLTTLPLLTYGVLDADYAMRKLSQQDAPISANHPQELTWIDRAVPAGADVGLVLAPSGSEINTYYTWWQPSFWNKTVQHAFALPGATTLAQGFASTLTPDLARGRLSGLDGVNYLVKLTGDARFGLRAPLVTTSGDLAIYRVSAGAPLLYGTRGVNETGALVPAAHPLIRIFGTGSAARAARVMLTVQVIPPEHGCPCRLYAGVRDLGVRLPTATAAVDPVVDVARAITVPSAGGHVDLLLTVRGSGGRPASSAMLLSSVSVLG